MLGCGKSGFSAEAPVEEEVGVVEGLDSCFVFPGGVSKKRAGTEEEEEKLFHGLTGNRWSIAGLNSSSKEEGENGSVSSSMVFVERRESFLARQGSF